MKLRYFICLAAAMLICAPPLPAQEYPASLLEVSKSAICTGVVDHRPVDPGTQFPADIGRVYCFSRISNIESASSIYHVWYFGNAERARVELAVNPPTWRTYSSKRILPDEIGRWRVDILDREGNVLKTLGFDVTP